MFLFLSVSGGCPTHQKNARPPDRSGTRQVLPENERLKVKASFGSSSFRWSVLVTEIDLRTQTSWTPATHTNTKQSTRTRTPGSWIEFVYEQRFQR